jgi:hypothetical protein
VVVGVSKTKSKRRKGKAGRVQLLHRRGGLKGVERQDRHPVVPLGDGELGYCMDPTRTDDCFRSAIATATQIPVEQVPDPRLDRRLAAGDDPQTIGRETWERLAVWLADRGLRLVFHEAVPVERERWIGVIPWVASPERRSSPPAAGYIWRDNPFNDHCLVMTYGDIHFDPAVSAKVPPGMRLPAWRVSDVYYGISFDRQEES